MFTDHELVLIYTDQREILENVHLGNYDNCSVADCPPEHFEEDIEDIFLRQGIMKKISLRKDR